MLVGWFGHGIVPISVRPAGWAPVGVTIVLFAVALLIWAAATFRAHGTAIEPWKPTTTIVTSGPFAYSRNPVYIAFAFIHVGVGVWVNRGAIVWLVLPAIVATHLLIVPREEAYLRRKFGAGYGEYCARVRRWL